MLNKFTKRFMKVAALVLVVVLGLGLMPENMVFADGQGEDVSPTSLAGNYVDMMPLSEFAENWGLDVGGVALNIGDSAFNVTNPPYIKYRHLYLYDTILGGRQITSYIMEHIGTWELRHHVKSPMYAPPLCNVNYIPTRLTPMYYAQGMYSFVIVVRRHPLPNPPFQATWHPLIAGWHEFGISTVVNIQRTGSFIDIRQDGTSLLRNEDSSLAQGQSHFAPSTGINPDTSAPILNQSMNYTAQAPAQDPTTIIVGRPAHDNHGDFALTWAIYNVANIRIAQISAPVGANYTIDIATHPLLNPGGISIFSEGAIYTIRTAVYDIVPNYGWGGQTVPPDNSLYSYSSARFVFGDPPDEPTPTPAIFTITKDLLLPPGTDMPTDPFHFDFTATFLPDEFWPPVSNSPTNVQLAPPPIRIPFTYCMYYDYATSVTVGGVTYSSITQSTTIDLNAVNWPRPGIYTFRIAETPNSSGLHGTDGITMDYDPTLFYLVVHVIFPDGDFSRPLEVSFFGISHSRVPHADYPNCPGIRDNVGNFTCECTPGIDYSTVENKPRNVTFTNYLRRPPANTYFEVEKRLAGDMANTDAQYTITVYLYEDYTRTTLLTLATGAGHPDAIYAYIYGYQRNATTGFVMPSEPKERVSRTRVTGLPHAANLRHGDTIRFTNVPVGTGFRVVEAYMPGYIQTASVVTGGGTATDVPNPATGVNLVASGTIAALPQGTAPPAGGVFNYVTVTNAHDDTPPTGVFMQNVPFGLMVAMGAGAMALTATVAIAYKKKK